MHIKVDLVPKDFIKPMLKDRILQDCQVLHRFVHILCTFRCSLRLNNQGLFTPMLLKVVYLKNLSLSFRAGATLKDIKAQKRLKTLGTVSFNGQLAQI
jgi:hypothetical protein